MTIETQTPIETYAKTYTAHHDRKASVANHIPAVRRFAAYIEAGVTREACEQYRADIANDSGIPMLTSKNKHLQHARQYLKWLRNMGHDATPPERTNQWLTSFRTESTLPYALRKSEIAAIVATAATWPHPIAAYTLLSLCIPGRQQELCALEAKHWDAETRTLLIGATKTRSQRAMRAEFMGPGLALLHRLMEAKPKGPLVSFDARDFKKLTRAAGVTCTSKITRVTWQSWLRSAGMLVQTVDDALGHSAGVGLSHYTDRRVAGAMGSTSLAAALALEAEFAAACASCVL